MSLWWVYMIETGSGKLYTGITTDVERRYREHCDDPRRSAKFFRTDPPRALVYREGCEGRSEASRREAAIKKMPRGDKWVLIAGQSGSAGVPVSATGARDGNAEKSAENKALS